MKGLHLRVQMDCFMIMVFELKVKIDESFQG